MEEAGGTGWGGVEGRGENAENCNCIKINKLIKKTTKKNKMQLMIEEELLYFILSLHRIEVCYVWKTIEQSCPEQSET